MIVYSLYHGCILVPAASLRVTWLSPPLQALRLIFGALHMPGEAQKVDRIMEAFAAALYRDAPGPFVDADAAYVCAFSLMMLNTDLHNPAVRAKMTLAEFADNNCGMNGGHNNPNSSSNPNPNPNPNPNLALIRTRTRTLTRRARPAARHACCNLRVGPSP